MAGRCAVCAGTGKLLTGVCPLCDGDLGWPILQPSAVPLDRLRSAPEVVMSDLTVSHCHDSAQAFVAHSESAGSCFGIDFGDEDVSPTHAPLWVANFALDGGPSQATHVSKVLMKRMQSDPVTERQRMAGWERFAGCLDFFSLHKGRPALGGRHGGAIEELQQKPGQPFRVGRLTFPDSQQFVGMNDGGDGIIEEIGISRCVPFKSLAFKVGDDFVVCAIAGDQPVAAAALRRAHWETKPKISGDILTSYMELKSRNVKRPKGAPKPTPEEIAAMGEIRQRLRQLEEEAKNNLKVQGASETHQKLKLIEMQQDSESAIGSIPVTLAQEEEMTLITTCIRGGLNPLRHMYENKNVPVYIDKGSVDNLPLDCKWIIVGGCAPTSCFFIPANAFRNYVYADVETKVVHLA